MATTDGDLRDLLSRVPAFETLGENDLQRVAEVAVPRRFARQEVIFREGDDSDTCYIVRSGQARAVREHPDGRTITLARFGPGDIFGELAMFDDEKRSATVELVEDTEVVGILGTDMRRLMREHPDIAPKLVISLGRRLREANERLARQSFQTVQSRVAVVLRDLVDQARDGDGQTGDVLLRITQADIAQLAGSSRESASRFLATLERAGRADAGTRTDRGPRSRRARRVRVLVGGRPSSPEHEFSAGGVVVRGAPDVPECVVIVPSRRAASGAKVLALPKGHPDGDESAAQAALREVREETGVQARVVERLGEVRYWYQREGRRIVKVVAFFLLEHEAGDPESHVDHEIDEARWMPLEQAARDLTHAGEREIAALALSRVASGR